MQCISLFTAVQYSAIYEYKGDWGTDKCKLHINTGEHTTMITLLDNTTIHIKLAE